MAWNLAGATWHTAYSLATLAKQIDARWPNRNTASDGTAASASHTAKNPNSDHEIGVPPIGVVCAIDITDDDTAGADMSKVAEAIRLSRDPRVKYAIHNRAMFSSYTSSTGIPPFTWRAYTGTNPHTSHLHVSVVSTKALYDNPSTWSIGDGETIGVNEMALKRNDQGTGVRNGQEALNEWERTFTTDEDDPWFPLKEDGIYGENTEDAVVAFQTAYGFPPTGILDGVTYASLLRFAPVGKVINKVVKHPPVTGLTIAAGDARYLLSGATYTITKPNT